MSAPTFVSFDVEGRKVHYRGALGHAYEFTVDVPAPLKVLHGSCLRSKDSRKVFTVIGASASATPCDLWIHERGASGAVAVAGLRSAADLADKYDVLDRPDGAPMLGPLRVSYFFNVSDAHLVAQFGVSCGEQYFLKLWGSNIRIVGELFGVLWVSREDQPNIALPLPGCTNEDVLHGVFSLCDYVHSRGHRQADLTPSPRRATNTPRRAGAGGAEMTVDHSKMTAACVGPMGARLTCDFSPSAMQPFDLMHNQRLVARRGVDQGKLCRVVGVSNGSLYVIFDGSARVSCVRNCTSAKCVLDLFELGKTSEGAAKRPTASAVASGDTPASPRFRNSMRMFWTSFGRLEFDTDDSACGAFGFHHGQIVRGGVGPVKGKVFSIIGVRLGNLWVLEEGKYRVMPLPHCPDKEAVKAAYRFVPTGALKDLRQYYECAQEPPATPMTTPRFRLSASPRREMSEEPLTMEPPSPRPSRSPETQRATVTVGGVPSLNFGALPQPSSARPTVVGPMETPHEDRDSYSPRSVVRAPMTPESSRAEPPAVASPAAVLLQPSAREFLKAFALLRMGEMGRSRPAALAFHEYYMKDTLSRVNEAFDRLPRARALWNHEHRTPEFYQASSTDILRFLNERPSVTAF